MLALEPPGGAGAEPLQRALDAFVGPPFDPVAYLSDDDPELLEAGVRARRELEAMRARFARGVPPREQLLVKAPFRAPEGRVEWMWVDVVSWRGDAIDGLLDNEPLHVPDLAVGARVKVSFLEVRDYVHLHDDGSSRGGYSIEIMRKRGLIPADSAAQ